MPSPPFSLYMHRKKKRFCLEVCLVSSVSGERLGGSLGSQTQTLYVTVILCPRRHPVSIFHKNDQKRSQSSCFSGVHFLHVWSCMCVCVEEMEGRVCVNRLLAYHPNANNKRHFSSPLSSRPQTTSLTLYSRLKQHSGSERQTDTHSRRQSS